MIRFISCTLLFSIFLSCSTEKRPGEKESYTLPWTAEEDIPMRNLFIIGGGERSSDMIQFLADSCVWKEGDIVILPWASSEPDTAAYYIERQLTEATNRNVISFTGTPQSLSIDEISSIRDAALIYITGGDQNRFFQAVEGTQVEKAIVFSQEFGSCVAGTSAGAAMMSKVMITGDENFEDEYRSTYRKLWQGNALYSEGLGLVDEFIVDQHFVARSRYNRLISAVCEYPGTRGLGVDESTAAWITGNTLRVVGESQVIVFHAPESIRSDWRNLGARGLVLDILLPGDKIDF